MSYSMLFCSSIPLLAYHQSGICIDKGLKASWRLLSVLCMCCQLANSRNRPTLLTTGSLVEDALVKQISTLYITKYIYAHPSPGCRMEAHYSRELCHQVWISSAVRHALPHYTRAINHEVFAERFSFSKSFIYLRTSDTYLVYIPAQP